MALALMLMTIVTIVLQSQVMEARAQVTEGSTEGAQALPAVRSRPGQARKRSVDGSGRRGQKGMRHRGMSREGAWECDRRGGHRSTVLGHLL